MQQSIVDELCEAITAAERRAIAERWAKITGKSVKHIYVLARKGGWQSGRTTRKDKGTLRSGLTDDQINAVANLLHRPARLNRKNFAAVTDVHEVAVDSGILAPGQVTTGHLGRILRDRKISKRHAAAPTPHVKLAAAHPNHVW